MNSFEETESLCFQSFEETESLCFQSDDNVIKSILDNKSDYTELRIDRKHLSHFELNRNKYIKLYGNADLLLLIMNAMEKNEYIDSIYIQCDIIISKYKKTKLLSVKMFKSIYIDKYSLEVLEYLNTNENRVEKLKLSSILWNNFEHIPKTCKLLKSLDISQCFLSSTSLKKMFEIMNKTNIIELIISINTWKDIEKYNVFISTNNRLKSLHIVHKLNNFIEIPFAIIISNNYTLLNVTINGKCNEKIRNIMNRNKKYIMTILLCMNKKIIPRCVFKSMILIHVV